jgi:signal transduction histidine kinase
MTTVTVDEQLIADLFDIQPDSVVWFLPVFENGNITDFEARYCNEAATEILRAPKDKVIGARLQTTTLMDQDSRRLIFEQCLQVWNNGQAIEYTYYSPGFDRYFRVQRSKIMGGILSITRDRTQEVKTELQIQEQAQLLHSVIEGSPNGIALYRSQRNDKGEIVDFRLLLGNQRSAEITAFTLEELYRYSVKELMQMRSTSNYFDICKKVVETGEPTYLEYYSQVRKRWIAFSIVKHDDGYLLNYMDITATKKQAEQLNSILDASINGIIAMEGIRNEKGEVVDLKIIQVNQAFTKILRLRPEEVLNKNYLSVFSKAKEVGVFDLHVQVLLTGKPVEYEFYYDGESYDGWYRIVVSKMGENGLVQTFTETTESVKDKRRIEEATQFLQEVINGSHTGILVISPVYNEKKEIIDFRFKSANKTLSSLVNQEPEALIGQLHSKWLPEYKNNGAFEAFRKISETGSELHFENHYANENNDRWMDVSGRKIGDDVLVSFHEFTPLKKLQLQLEATINELKNSNERLSQFTHVASHDLKEPLRKIIMYSNLMEQRYANNLEDGALTFLKKIQQTSYRMQALINDLLTYAQINTKPVSFKQVALDVLIQNVLTDLEATIQEKGAVVDVVPLPTLKGDEGQLSQLFQNLISNALKFHKKGKVPKVRIKAALVSRKQLPVKAGTSANAANYYCISVADDGIGFSKEYEEKIFQLFQRLHSNEQYEGTGIGLAIASKVVENHQGFITTESEVGRGATFHVYLPAD